MVEETISLNVSDNASAPLGITAAALDRVDKALERLNGKSVDVNTGKISEASMALGRLRDLAGRAGSAMAMALNGVSPSAAGATAAGTKLSSVFDLLKKRADAFKAAEKSAFDEAVKAANKLPAHLQAGSEKGSVSSFAALTGLVGKMFGPGAAQGLLSGAGKLAAASEKLGPWMPFLERGGGALLAGGKLLAVGAAAVGVAAVALVAAAGALAYKAIEAGMRLAIAATSTREAFESSVKRFVGGAEEAHKVYQSAIKVAVDLALDKEEVLAKAKQLASVGFKGAEVDVILRTRADIAMASEERANAFQKYLEKLKSGKAWTSIDELAEAGINADAVLKQLSTKLGVSVDKVKEQLKAGKIDVNTGIQAIIAAAQGQYGGAAGNATGTLPALWKSLQTQFESLFDNVDLSGIKSALETVKKLFDGPDGEKFKAAVNKLFGGIGKLIGDAFSGPDGEVRLHRFITGITKLMEGAAVVVEKVGPSIISVIDGISKIMDRNGDSSGGSWLQSIALGLAQISAVLGGVDITGELQSLFAAFDAVQPYVDKMFQLGSDLISGLIRGMIAGGDPGTVLTGIVAKAIAGAAGPKGADAHSPSKKTTQIGEWMGQGLPLGMNRMTSLAANAGQSLVGAALGAANDNAAATVGSVGGAAAGGGGSVTIHVHVTAGAGTTREQAQAAGEAAGEGAYQAWVRHMGRFVRDGRRAA